MRLPKATFLEPAKSANPPPAGPRATTVDSSGTSAHCTSHPDATRDLLNHVSSAINILAVRAYGEAEFWLSGGKFFLIVILFCFTFITMVGGNPQGDAYGFRNWQVEGAPFAVTHSTGSLGRFEGFLACWWSAGFTVVGPEYISMVAAEAKRPRIYIKTAFKTVYWRFGIFFILGALCVGIVVPYSMSRHLILSGGRG